MSSFEEYAPFYDLFYRGKDYATEAGFVLGLLQDNSPRVQSILELGCGTGGHARHFVQAGCSVMGVDLSERMVQRARDRFASLPDGERNRFRAKLGNAAEFAAGERFDAVVSLFHVASYQTTNAALIGYFRSARSALGQGGLFLFDFWHGPGVLTDRPRDIVRVESDGPVKVTRRTHPVMRINENVVEVNYAFSVEKGGTPAVPDFHEVHRMRYLFLPEIEMLAAQTGFKLAGSGKWLGREPLTDADWYGYAVLRAER